MVLNNHVKAVLYEVSVLLAENQHDYEARNLLKKVVGLMNAAEFEEGRRIHRQSHEKAILEKICHGSV